MRLIAWEENMKKSSYHSALKKELDINNSISYYENEDSYVIQHDINQGIHPLFYKAKAIYSEPAWNDGYNLFIKRAGTAQVGNFKQYLESVSSTISILNIPSFIVMGKQMIKSLNPQQTVEIKLHGYKCYLGIWNAGLIKVTDNNSAIDIIADTYNYILDFSCGYGNLADKMTLRNKKFICSDINGKCLYYIAKSFMAFEAYV